MLEVFVKGTFIVSIEGVKDISGNEAHEGQFGQSREEGGPSL
jgi:hypothetical protein